MDHPIESVRDLQDELPYLQALDACRQEAIQLRIKATNWIKRTSWSGATSVTTTCLLRRVKHLCWFLGHLDPADAKNFPTWPEVALDEKDAEKHTGSRRAILFASYPESTQTYFAAHFLRARVDDPDPIGLSTDAILCYYRIVRELYTAEGPRWAMGGARSGGGGGIETAFVTMECARALGHLRKIFLSSADFLKQVSLAAGYATEIKTNQTAGYLALPVAWCEEERERVSLGLRSLLGFYSGQCLFPVTQLENLLPKLPSDVASALQHLSLDWLEATTESLEAALGRLGDFRGRERNSARREARRVNGGYAKRREVALSETSHSYTVMQLEIARKRLGDLIIELRGASTPSEGLRRLSTGLEAAASAIRELMSPIDRFMKSIVYANLRGERTKDHLASMGELACAALTSLFITDQPNDAVYSEAAACVAGALDSRGRCSSEHLFHFVSDRYVRVVNNACALGALSHLIERTPGSPALDTVRRMLRYFQEQKIEIEGGIAFGQLDGGFGREPSPWVTAFAALALGRLARMLDQKVNERVFAHFRTRQPEDLRAVPTLDELMCTDLGLASAAWSGRRREMATSTLERMRAQLLGPRARFSARGPRICSLILHGPPGTGKTTLAESLAKSSGCPFLLVTPGDLLVHGTEGLERRVSAVMAALCLVRRTVILFDEFDSVLLDRGDNSTRSGTVLEFLTGDMLPRLAALNKAARFNGSAYVLATNYVDRLDSAAVRQGRFDERLYISAPDPVSRACRLVSQLRAWFAKAGKPPFDASVLPEGRVVSAIAGSAQVSVVSLCKYACFTQPRGDHFHEDSLWRFLLGGRPGTRSDYEFPMPVEYWDQYDLRYQGNEVSPRTPAIEEGSKLDSDLKVDEAVDATLVAFMEVKLQRLLAQGKLSWKEFCASMEVDVTELESWRTDRRQALRQARLGLKVATS